MRYTVCIALGLVLLACSETPRTSRGGRSSSTIPNADASISSAQDGSVTLDAQTTPHRDAGGSSQTDGGMMGKEDSGSEPAPVVPSCQKSCSQVTDCTLENKLYDTNNYDCTDNACIWTGCNNDAECRAGFQDSSYICDLSAGLPSCIKTCTSPNDCTTAGSSLLDADNYECNAGKCAWLGCNSASECQDAYQDSSYLCVQIPGSMIKSCIKSCTNASDCSQMSVIADEDNYRCAMGFCEYTGCNSDMECAEAYQSSEYICAGN